MYNSVWGEVTRGEWVFFLVILLISLLIQILFLLNLRNLLKEVSTQNRAMAPNLVWLNFIPFFSYAWMVYTVIKIRDSVEAEFRTRGFSSTRDPSYGVGMGYAVLSIVGAVAGWATPGGYFAALTALVSLGLLMSVASLVLWILYWVRTAGIKGRLRYLKAPPEWAHGGGTLTPALYPAAPGRGGQPTEARCPSCGLLAMPGDEFCRSCGLPVETAEGQPTETVGQAEESASIVGTADTAGTADKTCPYCGETYRANARFCSSCGRPVS